MTHQANVCRRFRFLILIPTTFASGLLLMAVPAAAADGTCPAVFDALAKISATPHHAFLTETAAFRNGGKPTSSESILAGGSYYIRVNEKWIHSRLTPQQMQQQEQENRKNVRNAQCHYLRDELVNGESAALYSAHSETEDAKTDAQVWVSKSKSLPLKEELDTDTGDRDGKTHRSMRYEYGNVKPPMD